MIEHAGVVGTDQNVAAVLPDCGERNGRDAASLESVRGSRCQDDPVPSIRKGTGEFDIGCFQSAETGIR
jgi:hypothetical protein